MGARSGLHSRIPSKQPGTAPSPTKDPGGWSLQFFHPSGSAQGSGPGAAPSESPEHKKHLDFGNDQQDGSPSL